MVYLMVGYMLSEEEMADAGVMLVSAERSRMHATEEMQRATYNRH